MSTKYENGYLPKISYHLAMGNPDKVEFFVRRHTALYGSPTPYDWYWVTQRVVRLQREWAIEAQEFNNHLGKL
jgi:hypothetical protein